MHTMGFWEERPDTPMQREVRLSPMPREEIPFSLQLCVLQNCLEDPRQMAEVLAERTRSQIVQVIGKKIVLYREGKNEKKKIELPRK